LVVLIRIIMKTTDKIVTGNRYFRVFGRMRSRKCACCWQYAF